MPDQCPACGRCYALYVDGHTPNSEECLAHQINDLRYRIEKLEDSLLATQITTSSELLDALIEVQDNVGDLYNWRGKDRTTLISDIVRRAINKAKGKE